MKKLPNKINLLKTIGIFVIAACLLMLFNTKPMTVSAAEMSTNREVFQVYVDAPPSNFYSDNLTVSDSPMITVITHGLMQNATSWSNNEGSTSSTSPFGFAYDSDSIIEQLRTKNGANVYWAKMVDATTFRLMELPIQGQLTRYYATQLPTICRLGIDDFSRHVIIVFEATYAASSGSNAMIDAEFSTMLNRIVRDVAYITNGVYPKINLIGHSRGGITNLTYAMNHPRLINDIYSLGTPYLGSNFGRINAFSSMLEMYGNAGFSDIQTNVMGDMSFDPAPLMLQWNTGYASGRFSHINVHAFAGDSSLDFYEQMNSAGHLDNYGSSMLSDLLFGISLLDWPILGDIARYEIRSGIHEIEDAIPVSRTPDSTINEVLDNVSSSRMYDDLFVSMHSQLGQYFYCYEIFGVLQYIQHEFSGFTPHTRYYNDLSDANLSKVSQQAPPIVHNLEVRDSVFISDIRSLINLGHWQPFYTNVNGNEITGLKYPIMTSIFIPRQVNGITLTTIGVDAFNGKQSITSVSFANDSSIQTIGLAAFANCPLLNEIHIPINVTSIGSDAFNGCTNLSSFTIPNSVTTIGSSVLSGCYSITNISIPFVGQSRTAIDDEAKFGYLFGSTEYAGGDFIDQNGITYYIPIFLEEVEITSGTNIPEDAFYNCYWLENITLPNTLTIIGSNAFYYCLSLTSLTIPDSVTSIGSSAFGMCSALASLSVLFVGQSKTASGNDAKFVYIFGTLPNQLKSVEITDVTTIPQDAFYNCSHLTSISLLSPVTSIGSNAFYGCSSLASFNIPSSVVSLGSNVFYGCTHLSSLSYHVEVTTSGYYNIQIDNISSVSVKIDGVTNYFPNDIKQKYFTSGNHTILAECANIGAMVLFPILAATEYIPYYIDIDNINIVFYDGPEMQYATYVVTSIFFQSYNFDLINRSITFTSITCEWELENLNYQEFHLVQMFIGENYYYENGGIYFECYDGYQISSNTWSYSATAYNITITFNQSEWEQNVHQL